MIKPFKLPTIPHGGGKLPLGSFKPRPQPPILHSKPAAQGGGLQFTIGDLFDFLWKWSGVIAGIAGIYIATRAYDELVKDEVTLFIVTNKGRASLTAPLHNAFKVCDESITIEGEEFKCEGDSTPLSGNIVDTRSYDLVNYVVEVVDDEWTDAGDKLVKYKHYYIPSIKNIENSTKIFVHKVIITNPGILGYHDEIDPNCLTIAIAKIMQIEGVAAVLLYEKGAEFPSFDELMQNLDTMGLVEPREYKNPTIDQEKPKKKEEKEEETDKDTENIFKGDSSFLYWPWETEGEKTEEKPMKTAEETKINVVPLIILILAGIGVYFFFKKK